MNRILWLILAASLLAAPLSAQVDPQIRGAGAPSNPCANPGQMYVNTTNGDLYWCHGDNTWGLIPNRGSNVVTGSVGSGAFSSSTAGTGFQDVTEIAAPANPAAGVDRLYTNSTTHVLSCLTSGGANCLSTGGTVTSASFAGGLISVATATSTPAFTVAGTSGGIPYFSGASTWASSGALTANGVVLGGGAGNTPTVTSADSTTTHALFATAGAPAFRALVAGDIPTAIPIANVGSAGLSGTSPMAISAAGAISVNANGITASQLATQYSKWEACNGKGIGDGLNAIAAGTYLQFACVNDTGVTVTITGIRCWTDNAGTSTLNAANNAATALLTGAVTCNATKASGGAAGTQSGTTTLANGDAISFTFVADGTSKQTNWTVSGTY